MLHWSVVKFELRYGSLAVLIEMSATWTLGWIIVEYLWLDAVLSDSLDGMEYLFNRL